MILYYMRFKVTEAGCVVAWLEEGFKKKAFAQQLHILEIKSLLPFILY